MKGALVIIMFLLMHTLAGLAQAPSWQWASIGNDGNFGYGNDVAIDGAGNVYVTGNFTNTLILDTFWLVSAGGADVFIAKFSSSGQCLWLQQAGGIGDDKGISLAIDEVGNVYLSSIFSGTAQFGPYTTASLGGTDLNLTKFDTNGQIAWSKSWGSVEDDRWSDSYYQNGKLYGVGLFGNYAGSPPVYKTIVFGTYSLTSQGDGDLFILKVDTSGGVLWAKNEGGGLPDDATGIVLDKDDNCFIAGGTGTTIRFDNDTILNPGASGVNFIVKYDSSGQQLWSRGAFSTHGYYGGKIATSSSGSVYMTGYTVNGQWISVGSISVNNMLGNSSFLAKYSSSGSILWAKKIPDLSFNDSFEDIRIDANDDIFLAGRYSSLAVFGSDTFHSKGHDDILVVKLDSNGNYLWAKSAGGSTNDGAHSCAMLPDGSVVSTGYVSSATAYFDNIQIGAVGYWDTYVAKVSVNVSVSDLATAPKILRVYPNPARNEVNVAVSSGVLGGGTVISAYDVTGRRMVRMVPDAGRQRATINTATWTNGIYIIAVQRANGDVTNSKVVIEK